MDALAFNFLLKKKSDSIRNSKKEVTVVDNLKRQIKKKKEKRRPAKTKQTNNGTGVCMQKKITT